MWVRLTCVEMCHFTCIRHMCCVEMECQISHPGEEKKTAGGEASFYDAMVASTNGNSVLHVAIVQIPLPYLPASSLFCQMLNPQRIIFTSQQALNWMIGVAEGMKYLHSITDTKPMIMHRDLKVILLYTFLDPQPITKFSGLLVWTNSPPHMLSMILYVSFYI